MHDGLNTAKPINSLRIVPCAIQPENEPARRAGTDAKIAAILCHTVRSAGGKSANDIPQLSGRAMDGSYFGASPSGIPFS